MMNVEEVQLGLWAWTSGQSEGQHCRDLVTADLVAAHAIAGSTLDRGGKRTVCTKFLGNSSGPDRGSVEVSQDSSINSAWQ